MEEGFSSSSALGWGWEHARTRWIPVSEVQGRTAALCLARGSHMVRISPRGEAALSAALSDRPGAAGGVMLNYSNCQRV